MERRKEAAAQAEEIKVVDEEGGASSGGQSAWAALVTMLKEKRIWWLSAIWSIISVGMDGLIFWIPLLIKYSSLPPNSGQNMLDVNSMLLGFLPLCFLKI